ncbi:unnamed protein product [Blepharisma stoltei]|uniref:EF-hand domain-containing protein n=1 Tax=Blepharisma stoltei TaxID=1481888 RepID=A0AAU9IIF1_9CILI|nr:unnamed protein product [Blepharisma stoltei]
MSETNNDITTKARKIRRLLKNSIEPLDEACSGKISMDTFKDKLNRMNIFLRREDFELVSQKYCDEENKINYGSALRRLKLHHDKGRYLWYIDKGDNEKLFLSTVARNQQLSTDNQLGFLLNSHKYLPFSNESRLDKGKNNVSDSLLMKLQQNHIDIRTLEAIKSHSMMPVKDQKPKSTAASFKNILNSYGSKIPEHLRTDLLAHCIDPGGNFKLSQLYDLIEAYKFAPQGTKYYNSQLLSPNVKEALWSPERASLRSRSEDQQAQLIKKLSLQITDRFRMISQAFRFFDNDKDGKINFTDFLISLENFTIFATKKELKTLFMSLDKDEKGFLKLEDFSCLFAKKSSLTPTPMDLSINRKRQIGFISERRNIKLKSSILPYEPSIIKIKNKGSLNDLDNQHSGSFDSKIGNVKNKLKKGPKNQLKHTSFLSEIRRPSPRKNVSQL